MTIAIGICSGVLVLPLVLRWFRKRRRKVVPDPESSLEAPLAPEDPSADLKAQLSAAAVQLRTNERLLEASEDRVEKLKKQLEQHQHACGLLKAKVSDLQSQLNEEAAAATAAEQQHTVVTSQLHALQQQHASCSSRMDSLQQQLAAAQSEHQAARQQGQVLLQQVEAMQLSTSRSDSGWQQRMQRMQQQLAAADMARQHAQAEADQLRFQSGEATQKLLTLQSAVADIKTELHQLRSDNMELAHRLNATLQHCHTLQQQLAAEREARQVAERQLALQHEALVLAEAQAHGRGPGPVGARGGQGHYQQQQQQHQLQLQQQQYHQQQPQQQHQHGQDDWQSI